MGDVGFFEKGTIPKKRFWLLFGRCFGAVSHYILACALHEMGAGGSVALEEMGAGGSVAADASVSIEAALEAGKTLYLRGPQLTYL